MCTSGSNESPQYPGLRTLWASLKKSTRFVPIKERQNTATSTLVELNGTWKKTLKSLNLSFNKGVRFILTSFADVNCLSALLFALNLHIKYENYLQHLYIQASLLLCCFLFSSTNLCHVACSYKLILGYKIK